MKDKEYFALPLLSYSKLSAFDRVGPSIFEESENISDNNAVRIGSLVDDLLTDPDSIETKYFVVTAIKPTASLGQLIDACITSFPTMDDVMPNKVYQLAKGLKLWDNVKKEETYYKKFDTSSFWDYLKSHYARGDRQMISFDDLHLAKKMAKTLVEDIDTKDAFLTDDNTEVIFQHVELWGEGEPTTPFSSDRFAGYKSKFDILRINHNKKTLQFVDIKTMQDKADQFERSFWMFRYYLQDTMYQKALESLRDREYPDYTLLDPYNIVGSQLEPEKAYKFEIDHQWLEAGENGFTMGYREYKGYRQLTDEYLWHKETGVYNYSKDEFHNGRVKTIAFNGKL